MTIDTPNCYSCKYYKSSILYKDSCDKYENIPKKMIENNKCEFYEKEGVNNENSI